MASKVVLITGGSRGIGRALSVRLAAQGAHVIINYRNDEASARNIIDEIRAAGGEATAIRADVAELSAVEAMFAEVEDEIGRLDGLVVNAASSAFKPFSAIRKHHVERTMAISVTGFLDLVRLATPLLAVSHGRIIAVSGWDSFRVLPGHGLLGAAKAAMDTIVKYLAVELAPQQITIVGVCPGLVETDSFRFYAGADWESFEKSWLPMSPSGRFADPDEMAGVLELFLCPESRWINGQTIIADGGISLTTLPC